MQASSTPSAWETVKSKTRLSCWMLLPLSTKTCTAHPIVLISRLSRTNFRIVLCRLGFSFARNYVLCHARLNSLSVNVSLWTILTGSNLQHLQQFYDYDCDQVLATWHVFAVTLMQDRQVVTELLRVECKRFSNC